MNEVEQKVNELRSLMREMKRVVIAYSGGVDSSLLAVVAGQELQDKAVAITGVSPSLASAEAEEAAAIANAFGVRHETIHANEFEDPRYLKNDAERCYWCKHSLFELLTVYAREHGYFFVLDGNNADDRGDYRPGHRAALERGVRSPLMELEFSKNQIREAARLLNLPNWNKPAKACLSSRLPYGTPVTEGALRTIESAEQYIEKVAAGQVRVRHYGETARIEVEPAAFERILAAREHLVQELQRLGYKYITLDLQGYRSGSLNQILR